MTVKITAHGKDKCPDWPRIVEALPPALVPVFWNILEDVIRNSDSTVILEFYAALADRWDGMTRGQRKSAAGEGEERFFTEEAFARDDQNRREAQSIVDTQRKEGGRLWLPPGSSNGNGR